MHLAMTPFPATPRSSHPTRRAASEDELGGHMAPDTRKPRTVVYETSDLDRLGLLDVTR